MSVTKERSVTRYSDEVRESSVRLYLQERNLAEVARLLGIPHPLMKDWSKQEWFLERLSDLEIEQATKLSNELRSVTTDSIEIVKDRLKNGDAFFDQKKGEWIQKPVTAREAAKIATGFIDATVKVERPIRERQIQSDTKSSLDNIAKQFQEFAKMMKSAQKPTVEVTDVVFSLENTTKQT